MTVARYAPKLRVVEAVRFDGSNYRELEAWAEGFCEWVEDSELHLTGMRAGTRIDVGNYVVKDQGIFEVYTQSEFEEHFTLHSSH